MTLSSHHISKLAVVLGLVTMLSLPGGSMALYSLSHANTQPHVTIQAALHASSH